jgi:TPR repeat protein
MIGYFADCGRKAGNDGERWHTLAAAQGHGLAQLALALHLLRASGGVSTVNAQEAVKLLELAAVQGLEEAKCHVMALAEGGNSLAVSARLRLLERDATECAAVCGTSQQFQMLQHMR